jgi:hypothetical protein
MNTVVDPIPVPDPSALAAAGREEAAGGGEPLSVPPGAVVAACRDRVRAICGVTAAHRCVYLVHPIPGPPEARYARGVKTNIPDTLPRVATAQTAWQLAPFLVCCGVLGLLAGCATEPESHVVSAPPPPTPTRAVMTTTTTSTPVTTTTPVVVVGNPGYATTSNSPQVVSTTVVTQAPPALQQEFVLAQPTPQHRWLAGYWTWRNDRYEWMAGHWEIPPSPSSVWVTPRWEQQGNAYKFSEGYWN